MSVMKKIIIILLLISGFIVYKTTNIRRLIHNFETGQKIDSLNGVYVYYNGNVGNVVKRNTKNGYNIGLEYQCVEFVKRYYYEYFNHEMPDSYGHAKSFFDKNIPDGKINKKRDLIQYENPSNSKPQKNDLIEIGADFVKDEYSEFHEIVCSKALSDFTNKWFELDGKLFREPVFLDGTFGLYSAQGEGVLDADITDCIFIDSTKETEFLKELERIIDLFKPD
ncbi:hypothetical protein [Xanthomarina spongicola]|uniref:Uncharacterized protein n=1 Tax=Xanthomarina spongicola TaxID=570520 RepID=A0A316DNH7_9FLAO|nr:hypothetical protein [Xanthomarina spongicola]PWK19098.1 hypothetical protein LX78_01576 [Xanthomarina spongicola]